MTLENGLRVDWLQVPLGEIVDSTQSGFASGQRDPNGTVQMRMNNVDVDGNLNWDRFLRVPATQQQTEKYGLRPGDVLFNSTNSPDLVGKTTLFDGYIEPVVFSNHFLRIRVNQAHLCPGYLARWLMFQWTRRIFEGLATQWVNQATVRKEDLLDLRVPLPPLPEQKRIAAILAQADRLRRLRRYALDLSEGYLQSVFLEMFGDPATNPIGWDVGPVEELLVESRSGVQTGPFGSALKRHEYVDHGVPVWGINNVNRNEFVEDKPLFVTPLKYAELSRYSVERGDILISRAGTVGRMCVARPSQSPSIIGTNLVRVRLDGSIIQPEYFSALFTFFANRIGSLRTSSDEGAYSFMNPEILRQVRIPTPPLQHQEHFVNIVQRHDRLRAQQREAARQAEHLFQTLLHKAFRGELSELDASPAAVEH